MSLEDEVRRSVEDERRRVASGQEARQRDEALVEEFISACQRRGIARIDVASLGYRPARFLTPERYVVLDEFKAWGPFKAGEDYHFTYAIGDHDRGVYSVSNSLNDNHPLGMDRMIKRGYWVSTSGPVDSLPSHAKEAFVKFLR